MRGRKFGLGLILMQLVFCGLSPLWLPDRCKVNRAAFERIEEGMTFTEVSEILGGPPGDHRTLPHFDSDYAYERTPDGSLCWTGDEGRVKVFLDPSLHVSLKTFEERGRALVGPVDRIRWRLDRLL